MGARRRLVDGFRNKFEPDAGCFIYWVLRNKRGYRVCAAERERFVAAYERRAGRVALVVNGWVCLGLFGGVGAFLRVVLHADGFWALVAAALAAICLPCWVLYRFSAWPDDELRGRPVVSRAVSHRERWQSDVMGRPWWAVGLNVALPTICLVHEFTDPARSVTLHRILLLLLIAWCLIGYTDLATKMRLGFRRDGP